MDIHWCSRPRTLTQNYWQWTRYFNVDLDSNGLLFLISFFIRKRNTFKLEKNKSIC